MSDMRDYTDAELDLVRKIFMSAMSSGIATISR
jgi:hypothetical protein